MGYGTYTVTPRQLDFLRETFAPFRENENNPHLFECVSGMNAAMHYTCTLVLSRTIVCSDRQVRSGVLEWVSTDSLPFDDTNE